MKPENPIFQVESRIVQQRRGGGTWSPSALTNSLFPATIFSRFLISFGITIWPLLDTVQFASLTFLLRKLYLAFTKISYGIEMNTIISFCQSYILA
jgi:hypothetical protein